MANPGVRQSITDLDAQYKAGNKGPLEKVMRAWKGIKELPPDDPNSFFILGGYHGEPFRGEGATNPQWWGGYCQHGTVLFPVWHRAYLWRLEKALQSIKGCEDVTLPFWDECSDDSQNNGIPRALTDEKFELDGVKIDNPLRSFVFPVDIKDAVEQDFYTKPKGYETVRYPLSGLVGTADAQAATAAHNAKFPSYPANVNTLNGNIIAWLTTQLQIPQSSGPPPIKIGLVNGKFIQCLDAPNYTLFSNTTSAGAWNKANPNKLVVALENPHNLIHLAVGGYDVPGSFTASSIEGANGDMGENETAGLDPIFFFHHCFIDYVFWTWQRRNGATDTFTINANDPGTIYVLGGATTPPADADVNAPMTMTTPLDPFKKADGTYFTSNDCVNIEKQLGYTYGRGSLDQYAHKAAAAALVAAAGASARTVHVAGLDRAQIPGSFLIALYGDVDGKKQLVDVDPVLSRWNVVGCANCRNHLEATADFRVPASLVAGVDVQVHTRVGTIGKGDRHPESAGLVAALAKPLKTPLDLPFSVEIR